MMKTINRLVFISLLMLFAAPSYSAQAMQIWQCEMADGTTENAIEDIAAQWLKAARQMKGGQNMEVYLSFPVAVNDTGEVDFQFVVATPSFEEWGQFWDGFHDDSPVSLVDEKSRDLFYCPNSAMWETVEVK